MKSLLRFLFCFLLLFDLISLDIEAQTQLDTTKAYFKLLGTKNQFNY
jgi:hypothetical protein